MSFDGFDASVLRAMLRLARRRLPAHDDQVALRVGSTARQVRASLRRLRATDLVEIRLDEPPRLTLSGLAVAVALLPRSTASRARPSLRTSSRAA
jgi:hypothetical protein